MQELLLINPNTSVSITEKLGSYAGQRLGPGWRVNAVTARFGAAYISSEASLAVAQHAVVDAYENALLGGAKPDAVLIGCFGDPGLHALQEIASCPVVGLAEASMRAAASRGGFAIVTGGAAWKKPLERLAFAIGLHQLLLGIETVEASGAELAANPEVAHRVLLAAARTALTMRSVDSKPPRCLILGGAGLLGMAQWFASDLGLPLLDSVECGVDAVARAVLPSLPPLPTEDTHDEALSE